jgi:hypothetical protein
MITLGFWSVMRFCRRSFRRRGNWTGDGETANRRRRDIYSTVRWPPVAARSKSASDEPKKTRPSLGGAAKRRKKADRAFPGSRRGESPGAPWASGIVRRASRARQSSAASSSRLRRGVRVERAVREGGAYHVDVAGEQARVHTELAHATRDELRVLRAIVQDHDGIGSGDGPGLASGLLGGVGRHGVADVCVRRGDTRASLRATAARRRFSREARKLFFSNGRPLGKSAGSASRFSRHRPFGE